MPAEHHALPANDVILMFPRIIMPPHFYIPPGMSSEILSCGCTNIQPNIVMRDKIRLMTADILFTQV